MTKLWGSRFDKPTDPLADQFSFSIGFDHKLAKYDVQVSLAHARMLGRCGIIGKKDSGTIVSGLKKILKRIEAGRFRIDPNAEDIHTHIQNELKKLIGPEADKLHTARSRNDLVVTDMKLYCQDELQDILQMITQLQKAIIRCAAKYKELIIPAYTHLQPAQVVLGAHYLLAYVESLERDKGRLQDSLKRMDSNPLGSCALSGTTLPIDRHYVSQLLGFSVTQNNSIDAVSDRDFLLEVLAHLAILGIHASRIAEDLILWSTNEFGFVEIDWSLCTGSSIMPHKKNPDILELIRGEAARLIGHLNTLLVLLKGLPLTYNRDLQLDKPPVFESVEKVKMILPLLTQCFSTLRFNKAMLRFDSDDEFFFSVDIMEYLIQKGLSYRKAHDSVGRLFKEILDQGKSIHSLSLQELKKYSPQLDEDIKKLCNPKNSIQAKRSFGSTHPKEVGRQLRFWKKKFHV